MFTTGHVHKGEELKLSARLVGTRGDPWTSNMIGQPSRSYERDEVLALQVDSAHTSGQ